MTINRQQLAEILNNDQDLIIRFENLFKSVDSSLPGTIGEVAVLLDRVATAIDTLPVFVPSQTTSTAGERTVDIFVLSNIATTYTGYTLTGDVYEKTNFSTTEIVRSTAIIERPKVEGLLTGTTHKRMGLTKILITPSITDHTDANFYGFRGTDTINPYQIYEAGVSVYTHTSNALDTQVLKIIMPTTTSIEYYIDGSLVYTTTIGSATNFYFYAGVYSNAGTITVNYLVTPTETSIETTSAENEVQALELNTAFDSNVTLTQPTNSSVSLDVDNNIILTASTTPGADSFTYRIT